MSHTVQGHLANLTTHLPAYLPAREDDFSPFFTPACTAALSTRPAASNEPATPRRLWRREAFMRELVHSLVDDFAPADEADLGAFLATTLPRVMAIVGQALVALDEHPDRKAALLHDPARIPPFVAELLPNATATPADREAPPSHSARRPDQCACPDAQLAQLQAQLVLEVLYERLPGLYVLPAQSNLRVAWNAAWAKKHPRLRLAS